MKPLLRNTAIVGALTMLSRVLGLVREMLQSRLIGAGMEQSAFTLAFAIPNMARKLFGEGALTAAFVPVFKGSLETDGVAAAAKLARAVLTMMMLVLASVALLATAGLVGTLAVRGDGLSPRAALTMQLVAILVPYMLAICGAAFGMGVLNSMGKFKAAGFMPALLNVVWIAALATLAFFPGVSVAGRIRFVAAAILVGGFVQMAYMFRCMSRAGVSVLPRFAGWRDEKVNLVWRNLAIGAAGAGAIQINYALDQVLAQYAAPWAAGVIGYAERLMDLPLGVIGVAFGTVLLPTLAGFFAKADAAAAREAVNGAVTSLLFVMLPAAAGLFALAPEITRVIYEGGGFDAIATTRVARALAVYAVGLGFFGVHKLLVPWFQAQKDMKTPLKVSLITVAINSVLNVLAVVMLPVEWRHVGLAASTVFCSAAGCVLLVAAAKRQGAGGEMGLRKSIGSVAKSLCAAVAMGVVILAVKERLPGWNPAVDLGVLVAVGAAVYFALAAVMMRGQLRASVRRLRRRRAG